MCSASLLHVTTGCVLSAFGSQKDPEDLLMTALASSFDLQRTTIWFRVPKGTRYACMCSRMPKGAWYTCVCFAALRRSEQPKTCSVTPIENENGSKKWTVYFKPFYAFSAYLWTPCFVWDLKIMETSVLWATMCPFWDPIFPLLWYIKKRAAPIYALWVVLFLNHNHTDSFHVCGRPFSFVPSMCFFTWMALNML